MPKPSVLIDTNVLYAVGDRGDVHHADAVRLLESLDAHALVAPTVIAEACYLLSENISTAAESAFLHSFASGALELVNLVAADIERMSALVELYADMSLGGTDASLVALAERLGINEIATFDRRHFAVVRPSHIDAFTLLP